MIYVLKEITTSFFSENDNRMVPFKTANNFPKQFEELNRLTDFLKKNHPFAENYVCDFCDGKDNFNTSEGIEIHISFKYGQTYYDVKYMKVEKSVINEIEDAGLTELFKPAEPVENIDATNPSPSEPHESQPTCDHQCCGACHK